jgi:predicted nucleic-acid-binding Zn-ribbon protein
MPNKETWSVPSRESISLLTHDQLAEHIRLSAVNVGHYQEVREALEAELRSRDPTSNYMCMKCGHQKYELNQIRATRSWLSSFFSVESAQYKAVVCAHCKFTEFYQGTVPLSEQALDIVFGR